MVPLRTMPNAVIEIVTGPGVSTVSPPSSGQPERLAAAPSPRAKLLSHAPRRSFGSASVSRNPAGFAPLAARSDRFTPSALQATASGGSSAKKCTPPTMASAVRTSS